MELFIQIRDGQPHEHPIMGDNFREAYPDIDVNNLPPEFARFERIPTPNINLFEVNEGVTYEIADGVVRDVWHIRAMTAEERAPVEEMQRSSISKTVENLKIKIEDGLATATSDEIRQAWQDYSVILDAWTLTDLANPRVPIPPIIRPDGTLINLNVSGSAPNVVG
jgi:hypothetical protein